MVPGPSPRRSQACLAAVLLAAARLLLGGQEGSFVSGTSWLRVLRAPVASPRRAAPTVGLDVDALKLLVKEEFAEREADREAGKAGNQFPQLKKSKTPQEVLTILARAKPANIRVRDLSYACRKLGLKRQMIPEDVLEDGSFAGFMTHAKEVLKTSEASEDDIRGLLFAMSSLTVHLPEIQDMLPEVSAAVPAVAPGMTAGNITDSLLSTAKLDAAPERDRIAEVLVMELVSRPDEVKDMAPASISAAVWAVGEMTNALPEDLTSKVTDILLSAITPETLPNYDASQSAQLVWGMANLRERDEALLRAITRQLLPVVVGCHDPQKRHEKIVKRLLPKLLCGLARLELRDQELIEACVPIYEAKNGLIIMPTYSLCALAYAWPFSDDGPMRKRVKGLRRVIDEQLFKKQLTDLEVKESTLGPVRWRQAFTERLDERQRRERRQARPRRAQPDRRPPLEEDS